MSDDKYSDIPSDGGMDPRHQYEQDRKDTSKEDLFQELQKLQKLYIESTNQHEREVEGWWNGLSDKEREDAFYAVVRRIHKAEIEDRRTYRGAIYDVFGFGPEMYGAGMDCGYLSLHNTIFDGVEYQKMCGVTRFEVIDDKGRTYVKYLKEDESVKFCLQDDDQTLKVFIDTESGV